MQKISRRNFVQAGGIAVAGTMATGSTMASVVADNQYFSKRPPLASRKFTSEAVEKTILKVKAKIGNPKLAWMFENCYPNTLDTTVTYTEKNGRPDTFVITGDILAMWLRDSSAQVWPYLPLIPEDEKLKKMVAGVVNRQTDCILIDPYANAFNNGPGHSGWLTDLTEMKPELHERKWEIDSLCYPIRLAWHYWKISGDNTVFSEKWHQAAKSILNTFKDQQKKHGKGSYSFMRKTEKASDTTFGNGFGLPIKPTGLICSAFRPSDDATFFQFLIPSNFFAVVSLRQMAEISRDVLKDDELAAAASSLAIEVESALQKFGRGVHPKAGSILSYEADGFGNNLFMDDTNIPSLLTLPYLDAISPNDPLYVNTRKFVLSDDNPWFFRGKYADGTGGPHVNGGYDYIWPMSIIMRAMTSADEAEIRQCLKWLVETDAGTGFIHEAFLKDDPKTFSRSWFAWANTLFGELIIKLYHDRPNLLAQI